MRTCFKGSDFQKGCFNVKEVFDSVLSDYTITDSEGNKVATGEKRIYAPNYIYV